MTHRTYMPSFIDISPIFLEPPGFENFDTVLRHRRTFDRFNIISGEITNNNRAKSSPKGIKLYYCNVSDIVHGCKQLPHSEHVLVWLFFVSKSIKCEYKITNVVVKFCWLQTFRFILGLRQDLTAYCFSKVLTQPYSMRSAGCFKPPKLCMQMLRQVSCPGLHKTAEPVQSTRLQV